MLQLASLTLCHLTSVKLLLRQFILALSSVELTSILVPSHRKVVSCRDPFRKNFPKGVCMGTRLRLRITVLDSSSCKTTVEGLPNVESLSTTPNSGRATLLAGNCTGCRRQSSKHLHVWSNSVTLYSTFYYLPSYFPNVVL